MVIFKFVFKILVRVALGVIAIMMINQIADQREQIAVLEKNNTILRSKAGVPKEIPYVQYDRNKIGRKKVYEL